MPDTGYQIPDKIYNAFNWKNSRYHIAIPLKTHNSTFITHNFIRYQALGIWYLIIEA